VWRPAGLGLLVFTLHCVKVDTVVKIKLIVTSSWTLFTLFYDARNHEPKKNWHFRVCFASFTAQTLASCSEAYEPISPSVTQSYTHCSGSV
jgi:hypothetical protein